LGVVEQQTSSSIGGFDGRAVANFVLDYCDRQGHEITNLALQKILFFCHAESLVRRNTPLIKHEFEAWKHGPVLQYLYSEFKNFDDRPVTSRATRLDTSTGKRLVAKCELNSEESEFLSAVLDIYTRIDTWQLVKLSHAEGGPWDKTWNHDGTTNPGMKITTQDILESFDSPDTNKTIN
jgi:uncharacterized phage-associated protein